MNKILLIISREYVTRVRKPAFLVITLLGPLLLAALVIGPVYLSMKEQKKYFVAVIDSSGRTQDYPLHGDSLLEYKYYEHVEDAKAKLMNGSSDVLLYVPADKELLSITPYIHIYFREQPGLLVEEKIRSDVSNMRDDVLKELANIDTKKEHELPLNWNFTIVDTKVGKDGKEEKTNSQVSAGIGFAGAFIMYLFIFLYGVQVMRGVMEEKTNRIVEVIVSSVRPFQLMMGKIIGVALVGLTQFMLWIIFTFVLVTIGSNAILKDSAQSVPDITQDPVKNLKSGTNTTQLDKQTKAKGKGKFDASSLVNDLVQRNIYFLVGIFIFYFLGGYLLYSALFAAVGSAVDSEADVQQFMLPVTAPVIFAIAMSSTVMTNPSGPLAVWLSMIPFTSPVIMMVRLPFLQFGWELVLSMIFLVIGFVFTTWLAGRIYRTGILMYGKKTSWKELGKWLFYKA